MFETAFATAFKQMPHVSGITSATQQRTHSVAGRPPIRTMGQEREYGEGSQSGTRVATPVVVCRSYGTPRRPAKQQYNPG